MQPELLILTLNITVIMVGYLVVYPIVAGDNIKKITLNDTIASLTCISVAAFLFWGTGYEFYALVTTLNWFWFTLITYFFMEIPFGLWYVKKYRVFENMDNY